MEQEKLDLDIHLSHQKVIVVTYYKISQLCSLYSHHIKTA